MIATSPPCPSACSTRAWAVSPCSTSAWSLCPARTSPTWATRRVFPTAKDPRGARALRAAAHGLSRDRAGQAGRRGLLLGHLGGAAAAAGAFLHAHRGRAETLLRQR